MDVKTVLLLGIGMAVLLLLGFCVAPSRSATLRTGLQFPSVPGMTVFATTERPVMLVGLEG